MRLRVTLLHDGTNADVDAALTELWRAIPPSDVDVHLHTLSATTAIPGLRTLRAIRAVHPYLTRDRADVVHAWLARPAVVCGLLRQLPDRPALITGVPGTAQRMQQVPMAAAAHIAAGLMADLVTTWHAETADFLVRNGLPSASVAIVPRPSPDSDAGAMARHHVRLYDEAVARKRATWRRLLRIPGRS